MALVLFYYCGGIFEKKGGEYKLKRKKSEELKIDEPEVLEMLKEFAQTKKIPSLKAAFYYILSDFFFSQAQFEELLTKDVLTLSEVALLKGVTKRTVENWIKKGLKSRKRKISGIEVREIKKKDLEKFFEKKGR